MLQVLQVDFVVFPLETVGEFVFSEAQAFFLWMPQCTKVRGGRRSGWDWFPSRCPEVSNWRMKLATLSSGVGCKWRCSSRAWSWYGPGAAMLAGLHPFYCYLLIFFGRFFSVWTKIGGKHLAPLINCLSGEKKRMTRGEGSLLYLGATWAQTFAGADGIGCRWGWSEKSTPWLWYILNLLPGSRHKAIGSGALEGIGTKATGTWDSLKFQVWFASFFQSMVLKSQDWFPLTHLEISWFGRSLLDGKNVLCVKPSQELVWNLATPRDRRTCQNWGGQ